MPSALEKALAVGSEDEACRAALQYARAHSFGSARDSTLRAVARHRAGAPGLLLAVDDAFRAIRRNGSAREDYWASPGNVQTLLHAVEQATRSPGAELARLRHAMYAVGRAALAGAAGEAPDGWRAAGERLPAGDRTWLAHTLAQGSRAYRLGVLAHAWLRRSALPAEAWPDLDDWRAAARAPRLDAWTTVLLEALWRGAAGELYRGSLRMAARNGHADVLLGVLAESLADGGWRSDVVLSGTAVRAGNALAAGDAAGWADVPRAPVATVSPLADFIGAVLDQHPLPPSKAAWTPRRLEALIVG